ncbi:MAG: hypothetical protein WC969_06360 [Elusimicrobiota bacterium]|jgi:hypothetical protein
MIQALKDVVYVWNHRRIGHPAVDGSNGLCIDNLPAGHRWNLLAVRMDLYGGRDGGL